MSTLSPLAYLVARSLLAAALALAAVRAGQRPAAVVAGIVSDLCAACLVLAFVEPQWRATLGTAVVPVLLYALVFEVRVLVRRFDDLQSEAPGEEFSHAGLLGLPALAAWEIFAVGPPLFMGAILCIYA